MNSLTSQIQNITQIALDRIDNTRKRKLNNHNVPVKKLIHNRAKWGPPQKDLNFSASDQKSSYSLKTESQENLSPNSSYISNVDQIEKLAHDLQQAKQQMEFLQKRIENMKEENSSLKEILTQSENYRKLLHSQLQELRGPIRVFCRVKPSSNRSFINYPERKLQENNLRTISIEKEGAPLNFTFDGVFTENSTQEQIFHELVPFLQSAIDGEHVSVFSYGQTGSGKTYTLEGSDFNENAGILPRAAVWLFQQLEKTNCKAEIKLSCVEIYMEQVTDLLSPTYDSLKLKECKGSLEVEGISWHHAHNSEEILRLIRIASNGKMTRATHHNASSSRSHTIYQIKFDGKTSYGEDMRGKLSVIDLAGSERANLESYSAKSQSEIETMKVIQSEAKHINTSLSCLRRVILALLNRRNSSNNTKPPYRESKLTRLLQDSLNNGKVVMLVAISPDNFYESKESLKFGGQSQSVK